VVDADLGDYITRLTITNLLVANLSVFMKTLLLFLP
jgi:hypothetical protein